MKGWTALYRPGFFRTIVYMLQQSEYRAKAYLAWLWRLRDFNSVNRRGDLDLTTVAKALLIASYMIGLSVVAGSVLLIFLNPANPIATFIGGFCLLAYPLITAHLIVLPTWLGRIFIIEPKKRAMDKQAQEIFASTKATKIAVAGSYGKTTTKEALATVLAQDKKVAFTEGNLNTAVAHARFANSLKGDEEVLIIEYGEYWPDDIAEFNKVVQPDIGVITGLNEAHLSNFAGLDLIAEDFRHLYDYVGDENTYLNGEDANLKDFFSEASNFYSVSGIGALKASNIKVEADKLQFELATDKQNLKLETGLVGRHNVATLSVVVAIAQRLGLSSQAIAKGVSKVKPFEHRLEVKKLDSGVVLIDDTYNGNVDGIKVGVAFLDELSAKRKVYVTPGLVEQGDKTIENHLKLAEYVAPVADVVVLMQNSVTDIIKQGLADRHFKGEVLVINDPLKFYKNLSQFTAQGDVVLMQNDWPDFYA